MRAPTVLFIFPGELREGGLHPHVFPPCLAKYAGPWTHPCRRHSTGLARGQVAPGLRRPPSTPSYDVSSAGGGADARPSGRGRTGHALSPGHDP